MKSSFLRICCAFLLLGLVLAGSMGLIGAVTSGAPPEEEASPWARILLSAKPGCKEIRIYHETGQLMQTLIPNSKGEAVANLPVPGAFYAATAQGCTEFSVDGASVLTFTGGCGWAEGLQLHLTNEPYGSVTIARLISEDFLKKGDWVHYTLKSGEDAFYKTLRIPEAGQALTCQFAGVPFGSYTLEENGVAVCRVTVDENQQDVAISLP